MFGTNFRNLWMTNHNHSTVEKVLNPLFCTLSVQLSADKMGMKPNCICVGVCVGIGVSSVWTVLHITIEPIVVGDVVNNGDGDGIGQCEHTITVLIWPCRTLSFCWNKPKKGKKSSSKRVVLWLDVYVFPVPPQKGSSRDLCSCNEKKFQ